MDITWTAAAMFQFADSQRAQGNNVRETGIRSQRFQFADSQRAQGNSVSVERSSTGRAHGFNSLILSEHRGTTTEVASVRPSRERVSIR